jgi:hypothetical protein
MFFFFFSLRLFMGELQDRIFLVAFLSGKFYDDYMQVFNNFKLTAH